MSYITAFFYDFHLYLIMNIIFFDFLTKKPFVKTSSTNGYKINNNSVVVACAESLGIVVTYLFCFVVHLKWIP